MKILLLYPPGDFGVGSRRLSGVIDMAPPLGIAYLAAVLKRAGHEVRVIDAKIEAFSDDEVLDKTGAFDPEVIGISVYTPDFFSAASLAAKLKSAGDYTIVVGGAHVSALPEETMRERCFDYGVVGEGEETMLELCDALSSGKPEHIPQIKGLVFRQGENVVRTPPREYIEDLDKLPFPEWSLFPDFKRYRQLYYKSSPLATIITSRGCPYQCTFCDRAVFGNRVRMRSINNILDEVELLVNALGIREINIVDDLFTLDSRRVGEFCRGLKERALEVDWACMSRVDSVTLGMLKEMKGSGCWLVCFGVESGDQDILDKSGKGIRLEDIRRAVGWARELDIRTRGFFILGLPGESEGSLRRTISFARSLPLDKATFHFVQPFPGSQLYRSALSEGRLTQEAGYNDYQNCLPEALPYLAEGLTAGMLRSYRKEAYRKFYLRPGYILRQLKSIFRIKRPLDSLQALLRSI